MVRTRNWAPRLFAMTVALSLVSSCGFHRKKYENPITKDTKQPDKVLFDQAVKDLEHNRFEVARLTLNTLMNTYDQSEFMAKAKLAYADSWYREGGTHGLAQAEAEYKDFILFYPTLEESAEAQEKVCMIHYRQMEKADRDVTHALRAEDECRQVLTQFPNSKFAPQASQILRNIQEVIAEHEMRVGSFYFSRGANPAAANRLQAMTDHFPLYSRSDEALMKLGDLYGKMGNKYRDRSGAAYQKLVREYPLSPYVDSAKKQLGKLELSVPEADPVAYNRMKYEKENRTRAGIMGSALDVIRHGPDVRPAAKSGAPVMTSLKPTVPASVPVVAAQGTAGNTTGGTNTFTGDVKAEQVSDPTALNNNPDARSSKQVGTDGTAKPADAAAKPEETQPLPNNHTVVVKKKKQKKGAQPAEKPAEPVAPAATAPAPAATTPPTAN